MASASGYTRGLGDKYVIRMDELVSPLDRHVVHVERTHLPRWPSTYFTKIKRRKVIKRSPEPDGGRHTVHNNYNARTHNGKCGQQAVRFDPPLYTTYIRNGTCTKYGAFPWTVQIQVEGELTVHKKVKL